MALASARAWAGTSEKVLSELSESEMMFRRREKGRPSGEEGESPEAEVDGPSWRDGALILLLSEEYERGVTPGAFVVVVAEDWREEAESETAAPPSVVDGTDRVGGDGEGVGPGPGWRWEEPWLWPCGCWASPAS